MSYRMFFFCFFVSASGLLRSQTSPVKEVTSYTELDCGINTMDKKALEIILQYSTNQYFGLPGIFFNPEQFVPLSYKIEENQRDYFGLGLSFNFSKKKYAQNAKIPIELSPSIGVSFPFRYKISPQNSRSYDFAFITDDSLNYYDSYYIALNPTLLYMNFSIGLPINISIIKDKFGIGMMPKLGLGYNFLVGKRVEILTNDKNQFYKFYGLLNNDLFQQIGFWGSNAGMQIRFSIYKTNIYLNYSHFVTFNDAIKSSQSFEGLNRVNNRLIRNNFSLSFEKNL